ncbi:MAG: hypothetical protein AAB649_05315 [Patescibacteria group bacterium]
MIYTLIVLLAGLLPTYVIRFPIFGIPTNLFEVGVIAVFILVICNKASRYQLFDAIRALPGSFKLFACIFLLSAVVSTLYSPILRSSLGILKGWIIVPMLFGLLAHAASTRPGFRLSGRNDTADHILRSLVLSGLVVALLGISQIDGLSRIQSIYDVPNSLALFLVPVFIIAAWTGVQQKNRLYQLSSLIMLIAIIATQSCGAIVAIVGSVVVAVPLSQFWVRAMQ